MTEKQQLDAELTEVLKHLPAGSLTRSTPIIRGAPC